MPSHSDPQEVAAGHDPSRGDLPSVAARPDRRHQHRPVSVPKALTNNRHVNSWLNGCL